MQKQLHFGIPRINCKAKEIMMSQSFHWPALLLFGFCRSGHLESLLTSRHWLLWPLVDIMYKHIQHGLPGLNIWSTIPTYQGPFEGLHSWNVANLRSLARYCALYTFAYFFRAFVFYHQTLNKAKVKQEMFDFSLFEDFATRCFISYLDVSSNFHL